MKAGSRIAVGALVALVLLVAVGLIASRSIRRSLFGAEIARFEQVRVGMREADVRALLGPPSKEYSRETAPETYYVEGYSFERRKISGKVLIYVGSEPIAYVYVDPAGVVEYVYVGGS